jgi:D-alanyl-D-alanine carboxypeptidase
MTFRTVYGQTVSEDGWRMCDENECNWITVRGTDPPVSLEIRKGVATTILGEFAARFNEVIEPLRDPDSACWTATNDVATSNHLAGTAMDLNWDSHPFHAAGTFGNKLSKLRQLLEEFDGGVWWGGDWQDPIDEMHFQLNWPEGDPRNDQLAAKLVLAQPKTSQDQIVLLIIAEAKKYNYTREETIAEISTGIQESNLNQDSTDSTGHRGIYQQDGGYPDRETAEGNIAGHFSRMAVKRASPGASQDIWKNIFWLQQRPGETSADAAYANGRKAYLTEIQSHIQAATEMYDRLVGIPPAPPLPPDKEIMFTQLDSDRIAQIWGALFNPNPSQSRYADPKDTWATKDFIRNDDGFLFDLIMEHDASLGDPTALARVRKAAAAGDIIAQHFLDKLSMPNVLPPTTLGGSPGTLPNDMVCGNCGKRYPSVLEKCPFCGATQTAPITQSPSGTAVTPETSTAIPTLGTPVAPITSTTIREVAKELEILTQFASELPDELNKSVSRLIPILQHWTVTEGQK